MRIIVHNNHELVAILDEHLIEISFPLENTLGQTLLSLANEFPDLLLIWCHKEYLRTLNFKNIKEVFRHQRIMASYSVTNSSYIPSQIGYVEDSPFCKVNYKVSYPTWFMSSDVGGVFASVLKLLPKSHFVEKDFDYFLNSVAKVSMRNGLFCYSEPNLINENTVALTTSAKVSTRTLFKFIKQHYKTQWVLFALCSFILFEYKFPLLSLINSFLVRKKESKPFGIESLTIHSSKALSIKSDFDVLIPTIGRKEYLYDVLMDLAAQTVLPKRVIIIEQNPDIVSTSILDYLNVLDWPFEVVHKFIHQTGACHARNIAIAETRSTWIFMADDDIRISKDTLEKVFVFLEKYKAKVVTLGCLRNEDIEKETNIMQWHSFGSGCSVVSLEAMKSTFFDMGFEHGFGEDADYGMQLRNKGYDILYNPFVQLKHLKAPIGGFRKPIQRPWDSDGILPKPSPTIMLYRQRHTTHFQLKGYKLKLFINFYNKQHIKNPFGYIKQMRRAWESSAFWANKLDNQ